jgi:hypothetical protein
MADSKFDWDQTISEYYLSIVTSVEFEASSSCCTFRIASDARIAYIQQRCMASCLLRGKVKRFAHEPQCWLHPSSMLKRRVDKKVYEIILIHDVSITSSFHGDYRPATVQFLRRMTGVYVRIAESSSQHSSSQLASPDNRQEHREETPNHRYVKYFYLCATLHTCDTV